jgi:plasmid stability protein
MRTTLSIEDGLHADARARAVRSGRTLGQVVEDALRRALRAEVPISSG